MTMHNPAHPGAILKELVIESLALTSEMALRLKLAFKRPSADHWLRLQNAYDLWVSRQNKSDLQVEPYRVTRLTGS